MKKIDGQSIVAVKHRVLEKISAGKGFKSCGKATYLVGNQRIHVRFCSPPIFKFNINPNTLRADYDLWICGSMDCYYLIPGELILKMYDDPLSYVDYHHPKIRIVSVDCNTNSATFASCGKKVDIAGYFDSGVTQMDKVP